jgi:hypothetical protein
MSTIGEHLRRGEVIVLSIDKGTTVGVKTEKVENGFILHYDNFRVFVPSSDFLNLENTSLIEFLQTSYSDVVNNRDCSCASLFDEDFKNSLVFVIKDTKEILKRFNETFFKIYGTWRLQCLNMHLKDLVCSFPDSIINNNELLYKVSHDNFTVVLKITITPTGYKLVDEYSVYKDGFRFTLSDLDVFK